MADTPSNLPKNSGKEYGASGTLIYRGIISQEEYNRVLTGKSALQKFDIMRRSDATVRSTLQVCKLPILSTTWTFTPAKQPDGTVTPEDQEICDFCNRELFKRNINFHDLLRQALTMFDFGHSVFEKVFELTEFNGKPRIGIAKIASRKQTTIYSWVMRDGNPGITQQTPGATYDIPMEKLIVFTNDKEGDNYEGISLLRYVYKDWDIKDKLTIVNAIALEKMAVGVPVIKEDPTYTGTTNTGDVEKAEAAMQSFTANEQGYLKLPKGLMVEMLDMKSNSTKDVLPTMNYLDSRIAKSVLAGFMEIGGSSGSGAKALAQDLTSLFMKSEEAVANTIAATLTTQLVHQLCDFNYSSLPNGYPELTYGTIGDEDLTVFSTAINQVMTAGALTPDAETEDRIREIMRLPAMSQEAKDALTEKLLNPPAKTTPDTTVPKDDKAGTGKDTTTPEAKKKAALNASRDAYRKTIEVFFADEA